MFGIYKFLDYFWGNRFFHRQPTKHQHKNPPQVRGGSPHDLQQSSSAPQNGSGVDGRLKGTRTPRLKNHQEIAGLRDYFHNRKVLALGR